MKKHNVVGKVASLSWKHYNSQPGLFGLRGYSDHNTKHITNGRCPAQIAPRTQSHLTHSFCKTQHPDDQCTIHKC